MKGFALWTDTGYIPACPAETYDGSGRCVVQFRLLRLASLRNTQSKINDPAKLQLLIQMIDSEEWSALDVDVKGEVYEGLLARNADDVRGGAGQYFTPRPVIRAIVEVMRPTAKMRIADPACGTGGFLLAAFEYLKERTANTREVAYLRTRTLRGTDLVPNVARLCAMNLFSSWDRH